MMLVLHEEKQKISVQIIPASSEENSHACMDIRLYKSS